MARLRGKGIAIALSEASQRLVDTMYKDPAIFIKLTGLDQKATMVANEVEKEVQQALDKHPLYKGLFNVIGTVQFMGDYAGINIDIHPANEYGYYMWFGTRPHTIRAKDGGLLHFEIQPRAESIIPLVGQSRTESGQFDSTTQVNWPKQQKDGWVVAKEVSHPGSKPRAEQIRRFIRAVIEYRVEKVINAR